VLVTVDGDRPMDEVTQAILTSVEREAAN
jgi:hypothetical protein